ncbi:MAG: hypothetical protein O9276_03810 [Microcystis sp. LE17-20A]|uniref:Uncharacterized protein n=1 Tax=Microcystis aeruginosa NIES-44 TaxID=449439 RepID=A0A0A1VUU2_MICAE|nr:MULTISPECIES: hypothetical protein [unclassified Microcystis]MBD2118627.1 hypothetical protein [Microcystis wesenbergii FACHB-1339]MCZ8037264.1 hypothetical protein [Microcystis sp. LE17-20A]MCZ8056928.1 hypothetical protein [Microcystis sp. LE19-12.2C]GAL93607.1 hypothetical protein N44_02462 [Microcystis aeruginosa NIES-44]
MRFGNRRPFQGGEDVNGRWITPKKIYPILNYYYQNKPLIEDYLPDNYEEQYQRSI